MTRVRQKFPSMCHFAQTLSPIDISLKTYRGTYPYLNKQLTALVSLSVPAGYLFKEDTP